MKAVVHEEAKAELRKSRRWYEKRLEGLGLRLLEEVQAAITRIERDPGIGIRYLDTPFRFYRVKRFPYLLYYLEVEDHLCVMAIAHDRRRPDYWKKRKPE